MAHPLSQAGPVWCLSMPQRSSAVRVPFGAVKHGAASAAALCTTRITISTTKLCLLEQVYSRAWFRRNCGGFPIHDIISLLHIEPRAGLFRTLPVFV
jgi:hypothetical protein